VIGSRSKEIPSAADRLAIEGLVLRLNKLNPDFTSANLVNYLDYPWVSTNLHRDQSDFSKKPPTKTDDAQFQDFGDFDLDV
jgi:hypothetical protein